MLEGRNPQKKSENLTPAAYRLGGAFNNFYFHPYIPGEMIQFDLRMFLKWVVQPPTSRTFSTMAHEQCRWSCQRPHQTPEGVGHLGCYSHGAVENPTSSVNRW